MAYDPNQIAQRMTERLDERRIETDAATGIAYRRGETIVPRPPEVDVPPGEVDPGSKIRAIDPYQTGGALAEATDELLLYTEVEDPLAVTSRLRAEGVPAAPNYVFFGEQVYFGNPAYFSNPAHLSNPMYYANPVYFGDPFDTNNAFSAEEPGPWPDRNPCYKDRRPVVAVLDTGIQTVDGEGKEVSHPRLRGFVTLHQPWTSEDEDHEDTNFDGYLDRQAGHGTFIAGIVRKIAPDAEIYVEGVLSSFGDGDDWSIAKGIDDAVAKAAAAGTAIDILNLSLGGYTTDDMPPPALAAAVAKAQEKDILVVAAAGNNNSCRLFWPAALCDVIGVGALDCAGRAWFSNHGSFVDACAPGVDVVSTFFDNPVIPASGIVDVDPPHYRGWAEWSGTSFAAPKVAAAIANEMIRLGERPTGWARAAAQRVVFEPRRYRVPDLGTVVNID